MPKGMTVVSEMAMSVRISCRCRSEWFYQDGPVEWWMMAFMRASAAVSGRRDNLHPSYCSTFKPAFQSVTYTSPSVVTRISADLAASATLGRGSINFLGVGGTQ